MNMRKITSLTALLSFILLVLTGIILYIVPHGRVAYWSDWRMWGLSKTQWGDIHINLGLLFLMTGCLHIYYNWKPIVSYLKNKSRQMTVFTKNFNMALIITLLFTVGTYLQAPPFAWVLQINESIKEAAAEKYGEPPYGHAELSSLKMLAKKTGLDPKKSLAALKAAGIRFESDKQSVLEISKANNVTPKQIYQAMKTAVSAGRPAGLPEMPKPGLGKRSIADLCQEYGLKVPVVLNGLKKNHITASADMPLKKIAVKNGARPIDIYEIIRTVAEKAGGE